MSRVRARFARTKWTIENTKIMPTIIVAVALQTEPMLPRSALLRVFCAVSAKLVITFALVQMHVENVRTGSLVPGFGRALGGQI